MRTRFARGMARRSPGSAVTVRRAALGALAALVGALAFGPTAAHAALAVGGTFGEPGSGTGQFQAPGALAIAQGGDVYAMDTGGNRVERFGPDGAFVSEFGVSGAGDGEFAFNGSSSQMAVDPSDGSVYVADSGNNRIQKFDATGAYVTQFGVAGSADGELSGPLGVAVDPVSKDVYVADSNNNRIERFSSAGAYISQFGTAGAGDGELSFPTRVAVDSTGRVYVLDAGNVRVQRFDATGAFDSVTGVGTIANSPSEIAVDPSNDHLFVVQYTADFTEQELFELDDTGALVATHAVGMGSSVSINGLAVAAGAATAYLSDSANNRVLILSDVALPGATIEPTTAIAPHGATFHGQVDPAGTQTGYHFEYSTDGVTWTSVPATDASAGAGSTPVDVSADASGLAANTEYRVRLVATKPLGAGTSTSGETTFTTLITVPLVEALPAGARTATQAVLGGRVNPENSPTTYYVEYGTTAGYGNRVPVADADAGSGGDFVIVAQTVGSLEPETTYHYRVVAMNDAGMTIGPDRTFKTDRAIPLPPPGRGWELVSPVDKNGGAADRDFINQFATSGASNTGDAVAWGSRDLFGDLDSGVLYPTYRSERTGEGWKTTALTPRHINTAQGAQWSRVEYLSPDLSKAVVATDADLTGTAGPLNGSWGMYFRNIGAVDPFTLLSVPSVALPPDPNPSVSNQRFEFGAATADSRHVVFNASRQLLSGAPPSEFGASITTVYEWVDGQVRLVSGVAPLGTEAVVGGRSTKGNRYPGDHAISEDGRRIFFTVNPGSGGQLYARTDGSSTTLVSGSERLGDDPSAPTGADFVGAKASDGSVAFFISAFALTKDAVADATPTKDNTTGYDLYRWDANAPEGKRLTDLTITDSVGSRVLGPAGMSDDGTAVYFVARGALDEGATRGEPNLYVWREGVGVRFIATLADFPDPGNPALGIDEGVWSGSTRFRTSRVSRGGDRILFHSSAKLTPYDTGGHRQVYLYDAVRDELRCVSCNPRATASTSDAGLMETEDGTILPYRLPRNISDDGRRTFFETPEQLVPSDTNDKLDVYEWFDDTLTMNGELHLISSGTDGTDAKFIDASASGGDVFFTTRARLVGIDVDNQVDVYDARVGGGLKSQNPPLPNPPCLGDPCQGSPTGRPNLPGAGSDDLHGAGDATPGPRASVSLRKVSKAAAGKLAHGRSAKLSVHVNRAGRVSVVARAKLGKRSGVVVARGSKSARRAGTITVTLKLSKAALKQLRSSGRLNVSLAVGFGDDSAKRTLALRVRKAAGPAAGRAR
jgi:DNA-binding beta-propeller fold protein YncE